ncbi:LodA/GoxA family CTQ-dependent oxidase [Roseivirga sp. BDSF3-8]|uniref:LodA/GoxA family CTQ-dependent oxidase n=1 Tax=Roseivirga sp. BDSF3-8 TaxID=3241598 RepID=UPI0035318A59
MRSLYEDQNDRKSRDLPIDESCSCDDPIDCLRHMFVDMVQKKRVALGQCPVRRPVFLRTHGIIKGTMNVLNDIPAELRQGMWAEGGEHPVYVRYSSDLADGRPDWMSTIGIGIKVFNVPGKKVVDDDGAGTADLLMQNVPFFFVDTAKDMCGFTKASLEGWGDEWIQENAPKTQELLDKLAKPIRSVFETSLWSVVPFKLGDSYCKYILRPGTSTFAGEPDINDPDFLGKDLAARMEKGAATLDIYIQQRPGTDRFSESYIEKHFPLDRATVTWDEKEAKPVRVATIKLPKQKIEKEQQEIYGDWLSFNIGRVPEANAPVGSVAEARVSVYQTSANYRRKENGQPVKEPKEPGKPEIKNPKCPFPGHKPEQPSEEPVALTAEQKERIAYLRIHPGIGVMRVGDSATEYYIGPETKNPPLTEFGATRDEGGSIKRQAARFRVYGYDKDGNVVAEVQQTKGVQIKWNVHLASRKAAWYEFNAAMDLPETKDMTVPLRNPDVKGGGRNALVIDAGEKIISGTGSKDSSYQMSGTFQGTSVMLGELRTDEVGRLLVLPGHGISASPSNQPVYNPAKPSSFNNASGWYDDIADGPVRAQVSIDDMDYDADPAWVISAPPNYGPDLVGWRTMNDLMQSVYIQAGMMELPKRIYFQRDVRPILERLNELQWVNKGFLSMFGAGAPMNFSDVALMKKLSHCPESQTYPDPYMELRRTVYNSFRPAKSTTYTQGAWPWIYGDAYGVDNATPQPYSNNLLQLPPYYDYILSEWVKGNFVNDYEPQAPARQAFEQVPLQQQPDMLDQSAMHFCLADAFHPGCELTWPMRHASMYRAPYRIRMREEGKDEASYGPTLDQHTVLQVGGPLYEQGPGDLTKWMALPWQGDTAYCRSGYDMEYDPYLPTYWPARVPNQVLTEDDYDTLCNTKRPMEERIAAFHNRPAWLRQLPQGATPPQNMQYMIDHFGEMGVLEARPRPKDMDWLPETMFVENLTKIRQEELKEAQKLFRKEYKQLGFYDQMLREAGWFSEEQRNAFDTTQNNEG